MAVAVLPTYTPSISNPFLRPSRKHINVGGAMSPPAASSSYSPQQCASASTSSPPEVPDSPKAFQRIRSSLGQSLRTATGRTKQLPPTIDEAATITARGVKGKQKATTDDVPKEKEGSNMLKRLESKVNFRRPRRDSVTPSPAPPISKLKDAGKNNVPTSVTGSVVGSLRQASLSSPTLLASEVFSRSIHSPPSKNDRPGTPSQNHTGGWSIQKLSPKDAPSKYPSRVNGVAVTSSRPARDPSRGHRVTQSNPIVIPSSPSTPSLLTPQRALPQTPPRRTGEHSSPPHTPTPPPGSRSGLASSSRRLGISSSSHLPLDSPPGSPTTIRGPSPARAQSSSSRMRVTTTPRGFASSSTSHLPSTPTTPTPRRASIDSQRRPSDAGSRAGSPSSPIRRGTSPFSFSRTRYYNNSTTSLSLPSNPEHRELIRNATALLCKELSRPPHPAQSETAAKDWEEVERRIVLLMRHERIWGRSSGSSTTQPGGVSPSILSAGGEEKEKRLFSDALKDGVVLCWLMNKLRSKSVVRPNVREDGIKHTSNVTKFLAACASYGLSPGNIFQPDDLKEGTSESLARVASTIIALIKFVDAPVDRSKYLSGQKTTSDTNPYNQGTSSRAAASTPNLNVQRSTSPTSPSTPAGRKRWSPPADLPTVRSNSPDEGSRHSKAVKRDRPNLTLHFDVDNDRVVNGVPLRPPPRSPLRASPIIRRDDDATLFTRPMRAPLPSDRASVADSTRVLVPDSARTSLADPVAQRQSTVSGTATETTMLSSLLEARRNNSSNTKYGTIRTVTTEATSESPSFTHEGSIAGSVTDDIPRKRGSEPGAKYPRERRPSEPPVIDLTRVLEEADESSSSSKGEKQVDVGKVGAEGEKMSPIHLGKGKWPDDFIDAIQVHKQPRSISSPPCTTDRGDLHYTSSPLSVSPPRKIAIVGASRRNDSHEAGPSFPRRPTQRVRHSLDTPVLLPKEQLFRDSSPDGMPSVSSRVMVRRHSTKPNGQRNGIYIPRSSLDDPRNSNDSGDSLVPFPRATGSTSPSSSFDSRPSAEPVSLYDKPRLPRGRFQSDIEGTTRRARPNSYDDLGARPTRSRFESMVNLGVGTSNASASDLMTRDSMDGSGVRRTLIIREEGKPPTHFQLGNCIGRGQFGSVYRALNLNTGQMVAVKRIRLAGLKEEEVTQLMREVDLVKSLSHPSIVKYEGMTRDDDSLSIVLEYAENGSLGQTLKAFGKLNERLVASYVVKILEGLYYLHQCDVVHCDLKAANILTTKNGNVKLSDFGVSLNLRAMEREIKDVAGTPNWMAPEVIELKGASTKSDIWSLACTVIELLTGRPPYAEIANSMSVMFRIVEDTMPPIPEGCSPLLQNFLTKCFNKDPAKRPNAETLCEHQWLKQNLDAHKELRRQDSIPFLRRVSAEYQKTEAVRFLPPLEIPDSPVPETPQGDGFTPGSPSRRLSNSIARDQDPISPREHSFVKTIFGKPMICKVCLLGVKKSAVLCEQCSLIAHSKCSSNAPPTCDLRAQLLLYAQYAQKGNPGSVYSNPLDILHNVVAASPTSEGSFATGTPRTSVDNATPPTAFKFMDAFRRSKSPTSPAPGQSSSAPTPSSMPEKRKPSVLKRKETKVRPQSLASDSTTANTSSMRSATTAAESLSSNLDARTSLGSAIETEMGIRHSMAESEGFRSPERFSPGYQEDTRDNIPAESRLQRKRNKDSKSGGCAIQ